MQSPYPNPEDRAELSLMFGMAYNLPLSWSDKQIERHYQSTINPYIKTLYKHKKLKTCLYIPGALLDWIEQHHPEYISVTRDLLNEKRLELLVGGYFDPLFGIINTSDAVEQIVKSADKISKIFRVRAHGFWPSKLIWDPELIAVFEKLDIYYCFLKDGSKYVPHTTELFNSREYSVHSPRSFVPMLTEHKGKQCEIFQLQEYIYELWKNKRPKLTLNELRKLRGIAHHEHAALTVAIIDDSNAPIQSSELDRWFSLLEESQQWIHTVLPKELYDQKQIKQCSLFISESMQSIHNAITNGSPASRLYAKMKYCRSILDSIKGDKQHRRLALELILQSQNMFNYCNVATVTVNHQHQYKQSLSSLLEAEHLISDKVKSTVLPMITKRDYNLDGIDEYVYRSKHIVAVLQQIGGSLTELSHLPSYSSLLDSVTSDGLYWPHAVNGEKNTLNIRNSFIDYLLPTDTSLKHFYSGRNTSFSLANAVYRTPKIKHEHNIIETAVTWESPNSTIDAIIEIGKKYQFEPDAIQLTYTIANSSHTLLDIFFGCQINLTPSIAEFDKIEILCTTDAGHTTKLSTHQTATKQNNVASVTISIPRKKLTTVITCNGAEEIWIYAIPQYATIALIPRWRLYLGSQEERTLRLDTHISNKRTTAKKSAK